MKHESRKNYIKGLGPAGFHKIAYREWGDPDNPEVLVCVHGLTRNSRDFNFLAKAIQNKYRVVCPDIVGRGDSDFTGVPATYNITQYVLDMVALLARVGVESVSWLGTSMGGIIGMTLASRAQSPIKRLILNDVGMVIPKESVIRIKAYASRYPLFDSLEDARVDMEKRLKTFGLNQPEQWEHMLKYSYQKGPDGKYHYAYDPALVKMVEQSEVMDTHMEPLWQAVQCPTLIIRGGISDLLLRKTADDMVAMRPGTRLVEIPGVGHAPALMSEDQIQIIADWLAGN